MVGADQVGDESTRMTITVAKVRVIQSPRFTARAPSLQHALYAFMTPTQLVWPLMNCDVTMIP